MKRLINKLVGWLNAIAKDKYQHFAVGAPGGGGCL